MKNRTFVIGDIHGEAYKLKACLESVDFDYQNDTLIQVGDVVDRGLFTYECIEHLLTIKNLVAIRGNHDDEHFQALKEGRNTSLWGGINPEVHFDFFANQVKYFIDENNNLFIHGGFNRHEILRNQEPFVFYWDRDLWLSALGFSSIEGGQFEFKYKQKFNEIFIGHTKTTNFGSTVPMKKMNIWNLDTGSGSRNGLLTIMNLETKEFKQF